MEFWEGVILVAGGLYLIGRMSRRLPSHPINQLANSATANSVVTGFGPTLGTNTDGSSSLVGGETLDAAPPLPNQRPYIPSSGVGISMDTGCSTCGGVSSIANQSPVLNSGAIVSGLGTLEVAAPSPVVRPIIRPAAPRLSSPLRYSKFDY